MACYWVITTTVSPPCIYGQHHLESMRFTPGISLSHDIPIDELLSMRQRGDVFLLEADDSEEAVVPAIFTPCPCGAGVVLRTWRTTQYNVLPLRANQQEERQA